MFIVSIVLILFVSVCRASGDRPAERRRSGWSGCDRLVAAVATVQSSFHQTLALRTKEPPRHLCSGWPKGLWKYLKQSFCFHQSMLKYLNKKFWVFLCCFCFRLFCLLYLCWLLCSSASLFLHLESTPHLSCSPGCMENSTPSSGKTLGYISPFSLICRKNIYFW